MRRPGNIPGLTLLLATEDQVVAELRAIKILAVNPCHRSAGALAQVLFGTLTRCDHPVLELPGLRLLRFAVLLVLLMFVVDTSRESTKAECETTGKLNGPARVSEG